MRATTSVVSADLPPLDPRPAPRSSARSGPRPERGPGLPPLEPAAARRRAAAPRGLGRAAAGSRAPPPRRDARAARADPAGRAGWWPSGSPSSPAGAVGGVSASLITGDDSPAGRGGRGRDHLDAPVVHHELRPGPTCRTRCPASSPTVVQVQTDAGSQGSGVILAPSGLIVTNHHVVRGATSVTDPDGRRAPRGGRRREGRRPPGPGDPAPAEPRGPRAPSWPRSPTAACARATQVFAIGSPFGLQNTVTAGVVSDVGRTNDAGHPDDPDRRPHQPRQLRAAASSTCAGAWSASPPPSSRPIPGNVGIGFAVPRLAGPRCVDATSHERAPDGDDRRRWTPHRRPHRRRADASSRARRPRRASAWRPCSTSCGAWWSGQDRLLDRVLVSPARARPRAARGRPGAGEDAHARDRRARLRRAASRRIQFTPDLVPLGRRRRPGARPPTATSRPASARCSPTSCSPTRSTARPPRCSPRCSRSWPRATPAIAGETHPTPRAVLRAGHPEPDRERGRLPAARGPGRPLRDEAGRGLPERSPTRRRSCAAWPPTRRSRGGCSTRSRSSSCRRRPTRSSSTTGCAQYAVRLVNATREPGHRGPRRTSSPTWTSAARPARRSPSSGAAGRWPSSAGATTSCPRTSTACSTTCCATGSCCSYEALAADVKPDQVLDAIVDAIPQPRRRSWAVAAPSPEPARRLARRACCGGSSCASRGGSTGCSRASAAAAARARAARPSLTRAYEDGDDVRWVDWPLSARVGRADGARARDRARADGLGAGRPLALDGLRHARRAPSSSSPARCSPASGVVMRRRGDRLGRGGHPRRATLDLVRPPRADRRGLVAALAAVDRLPAARAGAPARAPTSPAPSRRSGRIARHRGAVVLISDFPLQPGLERALGRPRPPPRGHRRRGARPARARAAPRRARCELRDLETGRRRLVDTADPRFQERFAAAVDAADRARAALLARAGARHVHRRAPGEDWVLPLARTLDRPVRRRRVASA